MDSIDEKFPSSLILPQNISNGMLHDPGIEGYLNKPIVFKSLLFSRLLGIRFSCLSDRISKA
jgi:hypothetical protein